MGNRRILIMAGGTGGHVFPGLAVAEQLEAEGWTVLWLGTRAGLETHILAKADIPIRYIAVTGLRGKKALSCLIAPFKALQAIYQSVKIIRDFNPSVVLGMGGFVSGPGGVAAWLLRVPLVIHEQNAVAGTTNRLLAHLAKRVLQAFPNTVFKSNNVQNPKFLVTGNPIRKSLLSLAPPLERFKEREGRLRLLIIGGSRGAQALNEVCPQALSLLCRLLPPEARPSIRHQSGASHAECTRDAYAKAGVEADIVPFIEDMGTAYAWADWVLCRAGALTVSELGAVGLGSILVPYPFAIDNHQLHNARFLEKKGGAIVISQVDLEPQCLADHLLGFCKDRAQGLKFAEAAKKAFHLEATALVADLCKEMALDC